MALQTVPMTRTNAARPSVCQKGPSRVRRNRQITSIQPACNQTGASWIACAMSRNATSKGSAGVGEVRSRANVFSRIVV